MSGRTPRIPNCAGVAWRTCTARARRASMPDLRTLPWWSWLGVGAGVLVLDQLTKWLIQQSLVVGQTVPVLPFFNLVLVYNPGAAFSFLSSASGWQTGLFIGIGLAASGLIVYLLRRHA